MERVGGEVRRTLESLGESGGGTAELERAWPAAVGAENARVSWPARLARDGTLHVSVRDSTWAFQLQMLAADVLEGLRRELGDRAPRRLKFAPGPLPEQSGPRRKARAAATPEERSKAAELASGIADERLRAQVARAAAASLAKARSDRGF